MHYLIGVGQRPKQTFAVVDKVTAEVVLKVARRGYGEEIENVYRRWADPETGQEIWDAYTERGGYAGGVFVQEYRLGSLIF